MSAPGLAARRAAAGLLAGVLDRRRSLADQVSDPAGPLAGLAPRDRARARSLASGALRHLGRIDALLDGYLDRRPPPAAMHALRLAAAELRLDGVPAHAAVDGAVRLVLDKPKTRHLKGLVNAVARRIATSGQEAWDSLPEAGLPAWIAEPVTEAWGPQVLAAIEAAHAAAPPLDLTPRSADGAAALAAELGAERLPTGSLRLTRPGQVSALPGFAEGRFWVQDAAAALPARLLGDLRGARVLDVCAAPGGKTLQLASAGAEVTALDASASRLARLHENLERTGLTAQVVVADARDWAPERPFDAVLLDAPCSATGTIRRHPDLPHVRDPGELPGLLALQASLLGRAWGWVGDGGRLVYCTCSLLPAEGEDQAARFAAATPDAAPVRLDPAAPGIEPGWISAAGWLRLRPDYWYESGGMDGFFAAVWQKPAAIA